LNITILGAGAIGSLWACHLKEAGHNVSLWLRAPKTSSHTLQLDDQSPLTFTANDDTRLSESDLVLITVKAWQVKEALLPLLDKLHTDTILVFMHNGMGAVEEVENELRHYPVVLATTTQAAMKPSPDKVNHTGAGQTQLGPFNAKGTQCQFLAEVFNHALPDVSWTSDIQTALWQKLAINCAINPLTALEQCRNGSLAESRYSEPLRHIIQEVSEVMVQEGIPVSFSELNSKVYKVITATKDNYSSMQQDLCYQRPTEIDFITGYLCRKAQEHKINVPANQALYDEIKRIEHSWRTQ
jgi:2-dehydropantoate 2-reductase